jgi:tetratricopeptide (TPR) repeat protein
MAVGKDADMLANKMSLCGILVIVSLCLGPLALAAEPISEDARRFFTRGLAAVETARSLADYTAAAREMEQARGLAPQWPDVYYNLGLLYEKTGNYDRAIENLREYLRLAPSSPDAARVQESLYKLEYLRDRNNLEGIWKTSEHESDLTCNPASYRVWRSLMRDSRHVLTEMDLEFRKGAAGYQVGEIGGNNDLPAGPPVSVRREGDAIRINGLAINTCSAMVASNHCPWQGKFDLTQTSADVLEGTVNLQGGGFTLADIRTERYEYVLYRCTGQIVLRRKNH